MIELTALMAGAALFAAAVLVGYRHFAGRGQRGAGGFISGFVVLLLVASAALYAVLGRWGDWQTQTKDSHVSYLLLAKVTEARRQVLLAPGNASAQRALALANMEAGRWDEALEAADAAVGLIGPHADLLGLKAYVLYYRDGKVITPETRNVIDEALAKNPYEVQTRMLLAEDAYFGGRYAEAVAQWRLLLDAKAAPDKEQALRKAIANAESRMARKQD